MRLQSVWAVAILAMVALSGCADDAPAPQEEDEDLGLDEDLQATEDTGIIRGVVIDGASITPVVGATVSIVGTAMNTTTNELGAFGFDGLEPGAYNLQATHEDYITVTQQTTVVAGEDKPPVMKIPVERNPATKPFTSVVSKNGFIACSVTSPSVSVAACNVGPLGDVTGNEFINYITYDQTPDFVQSEMVWEATSLVGESMSLSWTDPADGAQVRINQSSGPSPLTVTIDRPQWEEMNLTGKELWLRVFSTQMQGSDFVDEEIWNSPWRGSGYPVYNSTVPDAAKDAMEQNVFGVRTLSPFGEDCIKYPVLFDACYGVGGAGASLQQDYEIYNTAFFNFRPDAGWTFANDGEHPVPDA